MSCTQSPHARPSARSTSAMIASTECDWMADWIFEALPPLPANAGDETASMPKDNATAASLMFFIGFSLIPRLGLVGDDAGAVFTGVVVHAHVSREDELQHFCRRQLGVTHRRVRRGRERTLRAD